MCGGEGVLRTRPLQFAPQAVRHGRGSRRVGSVRRQPAFLCDKRGGATRGWRSGSLDHLISKAERRNLVAVTVGVPRETFPGERRVAITPRHCDALAKFGASVIVERSAGVQAGFPDDQYAARGARLASRAEVFQAADVIVQVRALGANPEAGRADLSLLRHGQTGIGFGAPLTAARECSDWAAPAASSLRRG